MGFPLMGVVNICRNGSAPVSVGLVFTEQSEGCAHPHGDDEA